MQKAILAGININKDDQEFQIIMDETKELCLACDIEVIDFCTQKSRRLDPRTAFRKGKLEELKDLIIRHEVNLVVFYNNLSIAMLSRIQKECDVRVVDRTNLILDIFSMRAKTKEAKLQTQLARLKYDLPKLYLEEFDADRQRGGKDHNRGAGETKLEIYRRKIEKEISDINKQLDSLRLSNQERSRKRNESFIKSVSLVGYTNAGKSSLMNLILKYSNKKEDKFVFEKDMLFATLDTSIRNISYDGQSFLLFDTVGFVSDLPHELIEAFKSTLDAVNDADLLIHVIDASDPYFNEQKEITYNTLKVINANDIPVIEVYNKSDKLMEKDEHLRYISCVSEEGIEELLHLIIETLYPKDYALTIKLTYDKQYLLDKYKNHMKITSLENVDDGSIISIVGDKVMFDSLIEYRKD
ncbi:MAG: GTPase HflX [Erysipelotrichaceae bacterium]|nr:GTPase HflX [Erysipelotrichaceae bacterium]